MASPKAQPSTLDSIQEFLDRTLVEVREIEVRTRSDDRVQDLLSRLRQVRFDKESVQERLTRIDGFINQMESVRAMLEATKSDIETEDKVICDSIATYQREGYTAGGPKMVQTHDELEDNGGSDDATIT